MIIIILILLLVTPSYAKDVSKVDDITVAVTSVKNKTLTQLKEDLVQAQDMRTTYFNNLGRYDAKCVYERNIQMTVINSLDAEISDLQKQISDAIALGVKEETPEQELTTDLIIDP